MTALPSTDNSHFCNPGYDCLITWPEEEDDDDIYQVQSVYVCYLEFDEWDGSVYNSSADSIFGELLTYNDVAGGNILNSWNGPCCKQGFVFSSSATNNPAIYTSQNACNQNSECGCEKSSGGGSPYCNGEPSYLAGIDNPNYEGPNTGTMSQDVYYDCEGNVIGVDTNYDGNLDENYDTYGELINEIDDVTDSNLLDPNDPDSPYDINFWRQTEVWVVESVSEPYQSDSITELPAADDCNFECGGGTSGGGGVPVNPGPVVPYGGPVTESIAIANPHIDESVKESKKLRKSLIYSLLSEEERLKSIIKKSFRKNKK